MSFETSSAKKICTSFEISWNQLSDQCSFFVRHLEPNMGQRVKAFRQCFSHYFPYCIYKTNSFWNFMESAVQKNRLTKVAFLFDIYCLISVRESMPLDNFFLIITASTKVTKAKGVSISTISWIIFHNGFFIESWSHLMFDGISCKKNGSLWILCQC